MREGQSDDYDEDIPEVMLIQDTNNNVHVLKGSRYGKAFAKYIEYPYDVEEDGKNNVPISAIYDMMLVSTFKIIALIEKPNAAK